MTVARPASLLDRLEWDSAAFGFEVGNVTDPTLDDAALERLEYYRIKCKYLN